MMHPYITRRPGGTMRTRTALATAATLLLTLGGCSGDGSEPAPTPTVTATVTSAPPLSQAEIAQQCAAAVAELEPNEAGEVPFEPTPAPCASLPESDYLDAYMDGIQQANEAGLAERARERSEAAEADQP